MGELDLTHPQWRKSRRSSGNGACVEVATNLPGHVAVRDSKDRGGEVLAFGAVAWREFVGRVKSGQADVG